LNPGRRGGKPATNRLSYGAAKKQIQTQATYQTDLFVKKSGWNIFIFLLLASCCKNTTNNTNSAVNATIILLILVTLTGI
jgi:hypothetical protein